MRNTMAVMDKMIANVFIDGIIYSKNKTTAIFIDVNKYHDYKVE